MFSLILNHKIVLIPSDFLSIKDIKEDIYNKLKTNKQYNVISKVNEDIFQSFMDYWIYKKLPNININNFLEYYYLSQEFDIMVDLIQLHKKYIVNPETYSLNKMNQELKSTLSQNKSIFEEKESNYFKIIQFIFNNNEFISSKNSLSTKNELQNACIYDKPITVDLFTRKQIEINGLLYVLNEKERTAEIFRNLTAEGDISIPRSIIYNSQEFLVTDILDQAFIRNQNIDSIQFSDDSEMKRIGYSCFSFSSIKCIKIPSHVYEIGNSAFSYCNNLIKVDFADESELKSIKSQSFCDSMINCLTIPSHLEVLENLWCLNTQNLNEIFVSSENKLFKNYGKFLLGKSTKESDIYDILYFAHRNIEKAIIPSFIKYIAPYSFHKCTELKSIEFEVDSELTSIGSTAFSYSSIKSISIPPQVIQIESFAFAYCHELINVEFSNDSKLSLIDEFAFSFTSLQSISIPFSVMQIGECCFSNCQQLKSVEFSEKSEIKIIERALFSQSSIENLSIPSSIEIFDEEWCKDVLNLTYIKILPMKIRNIKYYKDSLILGKSDIKSDNYDVLLFVRRNIEKVVIPSFIKQITSEALSDCSNLERVEFQEDSELQYIGQYLFAYSSLKHICIPSSVIKISEYSFSCCNQLKSIEFSKHSKLKTIEKYAFYACSIDTITIPSSVVDFQEGWCFGLSNLINVNILQCKDNNIMYYQNSIIVGKSDLKSDIFDTILFARRDIKRIVIPSFIKIIGSYSFSGCQRIESIEFSEHSELESIEKYSFSFSSLKKIFIPKRVKEIMEAAFINCSGFVNIDFADNNELKLIGKSVFDYSPLTSLFIPSNIESINKNTFLKCKKLQIIEISEKTKLKFIESNFFQYSNHVVIMIPSNLKIVY